MRFFFTSPQFTLEFVTPNVATRLTMDRSTLAAAPTAPAVVRTFHISALILAMGTALTAMQAVVTVVAVVMVAAPATKTCPTTTGTIKTVTASSLRVA